MILQRSAAEAEAPREAVAAALLLLLALILLLALRKPIEKAAGTEAEKSGEEVGA